MFAPLVAILISPVDTSLSRDSIIGTWSTSGKSAYATFSDYLLILKGGKYTSAAQVRITKDFKSADHEFKKGDIEVFAARGVWTLHGNELTTQSQFKTVFYNGKQLNAGPLKKTTSPVLAFTGKSFKMGAYTYTRIKLPADPANSGKQ